MTPFVIRRLASMVVVLWLVSVLTFFIFVTIPNGDPALRLAGRTATPQTIAAVRAEWGFDKPIVVQYLRMMRKVFTGSVVSYSQQVNVVQQIWHRLPPTLSLALGASVFWLFGGILLGLLGAMKAGTLIDRFLALLAVAGVSTPTFFLGAVCLYVFAYRLHLVPNTGYVPLFANPVQWAYHLLLPWLVMSFLFIGFYSRVLRSGLLETLNEDYVRTARAKGLPRRRVMVRHVLRSSLIPLVSLWGLDVAALIGGGAILTESIFNLQGVGQYASQSVMNLDTPPVLVITMFTTLLVVLISTAVDVLYAYLDPRIRLQG
jgi:peptide/nickel transport system permease protein